MSSANTPRAVTVALEHKSFVVLDGAVGTELTARGVDMSERVDVTDEHDDYWSGKALMTGPEVVSQVHRDYLRAGADVITTNSFRVNGTVLRRLRVQTSATALLGRAVLLARTARDAVAPHAFVGGSIGPLESCYSPELAPGDATLSRQHGATIAALVAGGVDLLLPETMNSAREARVVARQSSQSGKPFIISFCLRGTDGRLHSGDDLVHAAETVLPYRPTAILVNHCHRDLVEPALCRLRGLLEGTGIWFGGRPHLEKPAAGAGAFAGNCSTTEYVDYTRRWLETGARVIGGCCGTTPAYILELARLRHQGPCRFEIGANTP